MTSLEVPFCTDTDTFFGPIEGFGTSSSALIDEPKLKLINDIVIRDIANIFIFMS